MVVVSAIRKLEAHKSLSMVIMVKHSNIQSAQKLTGRIQGNMKIRR